MVEKNNNWKVLEYFFTYPTKETYLRELARELRLSMTVIISSVEKLKREYLLIIKKGMALTTIKANLDNKQFTRLKMLNNIERLYISGLVDFLYENLRKPQAIICFGSYSRGDDIEKSDIDIAVIGSNDKELNLTKFEKILKRKISLHYIRLNKISEEFKSNLYNGIVLEGAI